MTGDRRDIWWQLVLAIASMIDQNMVNLFSTHKFVLSLHTPDISSRASQDLCRLLLSLSPYQIYEVGELRDGSQLRSFPFRVLP